MGKSFVFLFLCDYFIFGREVLLLFTISKPFCSYLYSIFKGM